MAMLNNQRVYIYIYRIIFIYTHPKNDDGFLDVHPSHLVAQKTAEMTTM